MQEFPWQGLGPGIHVMASSAERALVNIGLVVGTERALVIDTGCGPRHGREILAAVRTLTGLPLLVANTHAHWDHFFGNAVFMDHGVTEFWAHANAARGMAGTGDLQRGEVAGSEPEMARGSGPHTRIVLPTRLVHREPVAVDLGGVTVDLFTLGRGHTNGDLMVAAPGVLFTGDVVEEGAEPSFEDSFPADWVQVLNTLAGMGGEYPLLVPGHGKPVDAGFVANMAEAMARGVAAGTIASGAAS